MSDPHDILTIHARAVRAYIETLEAELSGQQEPAPTPAPEPRQPAPVVPAPPTGREPSDAQVAKMQDQWRRLLELGVDEDDLARDLWDNYGVTDLAELRGSPAFNWFNSARQEVTRLLMARR